MSDAVSATDEGQQEKLFRQAGNIIEKSLEKVRIEFFYFSVQNRVECYKIFVKGTFGENVLININRWSKRKRGMASTPLFIIPEMFLHFPNKHSYGYLRFEGNGKIPLGR